MLVISDASPLNVLIRTDLVGVLPSLFGRVVVPTAVAEELNDAGTPPQVREFLAHVPSWLETDVPTSLLPLSGIGRGERAAISLAKERNADLLLIDDKRGRRAALGLQLRIIGTIGVLELAAKRGLIDLRSAFERIRATDFSVAEELLKAALERDARRRRQ